MNKINLCTQRMKVTHEFQKNSRRSSFLLKKKEREREQAQNLNLLDTNLQSCSSIDPTSKKNINKSNEKDEEN